MLMILVNKSFRRFCKLRFFAGKKLANGFKNWLMEIPSPLASVANAFFRLRPPLQFQLIQFKFKEGSLLNISMKFGIKLVEILTLQYP